MKCRLSKCSRCAANNSTTLAGINARSPSPRVELFKRKVFVSGCFDIIHAGHVHFLQSARALGDHLTVCVACESTVEKLKGRKASLPVAHKVAILSALSCVDQVVVGDDTQTPFDFVRQFEEIRPQVLAITTDDRFDKFKTQLCEKYGAMLHILAKTKDPLCSMQLAQKKPEAVRVPLRVDFAGGWLDVPRFARPDARIVNCAIDMFVTKENQAFGGGLGHSAAWHIANGRDAIAEEIAAGVGWQDAAVIEETSVCVWDSGPRPVLMYRDRGDFLRGKMAVVFTGQRSDSAPNIGKKERPHCQWLAIEQAGFMAEQSVQRKSYLLMCEAVSMSYKVQLDEGMRPLPEFNGCIAAKYCGAGFGGHALLMFCSDYERNEAVKNNKDVRAIEPFTQE